MQTRKSYWGARMIGVTLAVIVIGPLFPRDLYDSWFSILWSLALGIAAGQVAKAVARVNDRSDES